MATTDLGIYYPSGDVNGDFPSILANMAESVNDAIASFTKDSGWVDVSSSDMMNGWEPYNTTGSRVRYRKVGKIVMLDGIARNGTDRDIFVLPTEFRPDGVFPNFAVPVVTTATSTTSRAVRLRVTTTGIVQVYQTTQENRNSGIGLSGATFFVE